MSDQAQPYCSSYDHDAVTGHLKVTHVFEMLDKILNLQKMNSNSTLVCSYSYTYDTKCFSYTMIARCKCTTM